jgi:hypothetical protein
VAVKHLRAVVILDTRAKDQVQVAEKHANNHEDEKMRFDSSWRPFTMCQ